MSSLVGVLRATRPNFLILTPTCVLLGFATALIAGAQPSGVVIGLVLSGALLAHAAVNLLNEYEDYRSGLDLITLRTPFSGGSGALPAIPAAAPAVLASAVSALAACAAIGLYLAAISGLAVLPVGLAGIALVVAYTSWITRHPLLCLLAPGIGFGLLMVPGTHYALAGEFSLLTIWAALAPTFLVSALLLLNQFPDVEADRAVNRSHLPIVLGRRNSSLIFGALLGAAYATVAVGILIGILPALTALALIPFPAAVVVTVKVRQLAEHPGELTPWLGVHVATLLSTLVLLGIGLLLAAR